MIALVNKTTGTTMWVHPSRLEEYLAAGHKLAAPPKPEKKRPAPKKSKPEMR